MKYALIVSCFKPFMNWKSVSLSLSFMAFVQEMSQRALDWFIRDDDKYVLRIIKILEKLGYYKRAYYQVAAGTPERDYSDLFLDFGMAFVGCGYDYKQIEHVRPFDILILKQGLNNIKAVGEVVSRGGKCRGANEKAWLEDFEGWVLPYYCFVNWHVPNGKDGVPSGKLARWNFRGCKSR